MAAEQSMIQAKTLDVIEAAIMAIREADSVVNNVRPAHAAPESVSPELKQSIFAWKVEDKYQALKEK